MTSLLAALKARRRMVAPLIFLGAAAYDHLARDGQAVPWLLSMALVFVYAYMPGKYFQYRPRRR